MDDRPVNSIALVHEPVKQNLRSVHAGVNVRPGCAPAVVADLREFRRDCCARCWILHSREPLCTMGLFEDGGEGGIRPIECGASYRLAWPCSDTENKALTGISASAQSYRCVLKANS